MRFSIVCIAVVALACTASAALARDIPAKGVTREQVAAWLQAKGYDATMTRDSVSNDDYVSTSSQGANWGIYFYACDDSKHCTSLQYSVAWNGANLTMDQLNTWNQTKRFIRSYATTDGAAFGEYDLDIAPGGTWEGLGQSLTRWEAQMPNFKKYVLDIANAH